MKFYLPDEVSLSVTPAGNGKHRLVYVARFARAMPRVARDTKVLFDQLRAREPRYPGVVRLLPGGRGIKHTMVASRQVVGAFVFGEFGMWAAGRRGRNRAIRALSKFFGLDGKHIIVDQALGQR